MKNNLYYYQIKIKKLKELPDAKHKNNIEEGYEKTCTIPAECFCEPKVGERFFVGLYFITSIVTEIIDEHTFKTLNSIYEWSKSERFV